MDRVDTQEAGGSQERHWMGPQAEQSTLILYYWCLLLASGCKVLLGSTAKIKDPVALAEVVVMVLVVARKMLVFVSLLWIFSYVESRKFIVNN